MLSYLNSFTRQLGLNIMEIIPRETRPWIDDDEEEALRCREGGLILGPCA